MKHHRRNHARFVLLLLPVFILPLLFSSCNTNIVRSSNAIPDGWEIVSQKDNITHIRMIEGSNAYHWIAGSKQNDFFMDIGFPGNPEKASMKPDRNGNVNIAVYVGYDQVQRRFMSSFVEPSENDAYRLIFNDTGMYHAWRELYEFDVDAVTTQTNVVYDGETVGLTEAWIYSIPISQFTKQYDVMSFFIQFERDKIGDYLPEVYPTSKDTHKEISLYYYQMHNMIHFDETYRQSLPHTFPYYLYEHSAYVTRPLLILTLLLALFSILRKWNPVFFLIPCAAGAVFSWFTYRYYCSLPTNLNDMFSGFTYMSEQLGASLGIIAFIALAIGLLILYGIVSLIRYKRRKNRSIEKTSTEASSSEPPSDSQ